MSEDVYVLNKKVSKPVLYNLNQKKSIETALTHNYQKEDFNQIEDWIAALKSGKKIVNPMSPKEELKLKYRDIESDEFNFVNPKTIIEDVVEIIAKEYPDVKGWIKDDDGS